MDANIFQVAAYIVALAIFYGATNTRLKQIEKEIEQQREHNERLIRTEEKVNSILSILKQKN